MQRKIKDLEKAKATAQAAVGASSSLMLVCARMLEASMCYVLILEQP